MKRARSIRLQPKLLLGLVAMAAVRLVVKSKPSAEISSVEAQMMPV